MMVSKSTQPKILFILPSRGGAGGANSVLQEASALISLGCVCAIAVDQPNLTRFIASYPELLEPDRPDVIPFRDADDLAQAAKRFDIIVATTNASVSALADVRARKIPGLHYAYYVQDYEPLFYELDSPEWRVARESYTLVPGCQLFAKTAWLCEIVHDNHGVLPAKVVPSIDHSVFKPRIRIDSEAVTVAAMLRPRTPRRAARRTVEVLNSIASSRKEDVRIIVFGSTAGELETAGLELHPSIDNRGPLRRADVAAVLAETTMFIDLSDFQAFGRTAVEAMACGAVPVVPVFGGTSEFAVDGENSFVIDTRFPSIAIAAIKKFLDMVPEQRFAMRLAALSTAQRYSVLDAAISELQVFNALLHK